MVERAIPEPKMLMIVPGAIGPWAKLAAFTTSSIETGIVWAPASRAKSAKTRDNCIHHELNVLKNTILNHQYSSNSTIKYINEWAESQSANASDEKGSGCGC
jgi:hypothetical protein